MPYDDTLVVGYLRQAHDTPLLTEREKHLVGLAVTMTRGCQVCTRNRIEKARAAGIADDVLNALVNVVSSVNAGVTAATFGAGQYTLHHWKLASTSRGLLVISLLLAPLNLLLLANPGTDAAGGWLDAGVKAAAVLLFVGMARAAGRDLIGTDLLPGPIDRRWLLALTVVGAPASQALPAAWTTGVSSRSGPFRAHRG